MGNSDRKEPLTLIGPKGLSRVVNALRVIAPELPFEINMIELNGQQEHLSIKGYEIDAFRVNHAVTCYGYTISIPRIGKFNADKAKELGLKNTHFKNPDGLHDEDHYTTARDMYTMA